MACCVIGCGLLSTDSDDELDGSWLPSPADVIGFAVTSADSVQGSGVIIAWGLESADDVYEWNVYRTDGAHAYQLVGREPFNHDPRRGYTFFDEVTEEPSGDRSIYLVTAVHESGIESDPSPALIVPADRAGDEVSSLSPVDGQSGVSAKPVFTWDPVDKAETYCIVLYAPGAGTDEYEWVYRDTVTTFEYGAVDGVTYIPPAGERLQYDTDYRWSIHGVDENNFAFAVGEAGFTTKSAPSVTQPPTDIMVLFRLSGESPPSYAVTITWFVPDSDEASGCNLYRKIGPGAYEKINGELIVPDDFMLWTYVDEEAPIPAGIEYFYYATVLWPGGESGPSPGAVVPAYPVMGQVEGLSPGDGQTGVSVTPTFTWNMAADTESYGIILCEGEWESERMVWVYRDVGTSFECGRANGVTYMPLEDGRLRGDALYSWMIIGIDEKNFTFAGSDWTEFRTENTGPVSSASMHRP